MALHEEFLRLCAAATANELTAEEQARLQEHLTSCPECRQVLEEYKTASQHMLAVLAPDADRNETEQDNTWSVEEAEKKFFKRLESERESASGDQEHDGPIKRGHRFIYRPSQIRWQDVW